MSRLRFAPLLEAYCLYCGSYILDELYNEVKALNKYRNFSKKTNRTSSLVSIPFIFQCIEFLQQAVYKTLDDISMCNKCFLCMNPHKPLPC